MAVAFYNEDCRPPPKIDDGTQAMDPPKIGASKKDKKCFFPIFRSFLDKIEFFRTFLKTIQIQCLSI